MTYEEYVSTFDHECSYFCQGRATHVEIVYTDEQHPHDDMIIAIGHWIEKFARVDDVRLAPEAEDLAARSAHQRLYYYGPKKPEYQVKWLVIFTLWGEVR